jgi:hypothetical protein
MNHSRTDSASQYSHSRDRSETTSGSASLASEKRNGSNIANQQPLLPSTPLPLHRPFNETRGETSHPIKEGFDPPSSRIAGTHNTSEAHQQHHIASQSLGYPSQRSKQIGARSRSGSRSRLVEGANTDHDWSNSGQPHPPLPNRTAALSSRGLTGMNVVSQTPQLPDSSAAALHQRRQHGGSDPTQLVTRASREFSPLVESLVVLPTTNQTSQAGWKRSFATTPAGAPMLRSLDLNTLVEREDVHMELERMVDDLGMWLDFVGTGLAQVAAK